MTSCARAESANDIEWQHLTVFKQEQDEIIQRKFRLELPPGLDQNVGGKIRDQDNYNQGGKREGGISNDETIRKKLKTETRVVQLGEPL